MPGIFLKRGMTLTVPQFSLSLGDDGRLQAKMETHLHLDVVPVWVDLAWQNLKQAEIAHEMLLQCWAGTDEESKAEAIEKESASSVQAIVCMAIAIDALFATTRQAIGISTALAAQWKASRTARYKRVSEVMRRAFRVHQKSVPILRDLLKQLYKLRNEAVHPSSEPRRPILRIDLNVGVDHWLGTYSFANADSMVTGFTILLWHFVRVAKPKNEQVANYAKSLTHHVDRWLPNGPPSATATTATKSSIATDE